MNLSPFCHHYVHWTRLRHSPETSLPAIRPCDSSAERTEDTAMASQAVMIGGLCALLSLSWAGLLGGWSAADKNSEEVKEIAEFSVSQYNLQSNDVGVYTMISLKDAMQQVVSGMNYKLTMVLGNTACKKSEGYINKPCPLLTGSKLKKLKCVFRVYDIPWESKRTLTGKRCTKI